MIVQDILDPSGMFSKAGRLSLEMYTMLQEKDFILHNKPKGETMSLSSYGHNHMSASQSQPALNSKSGNKNGPLASVVLLPSHSSLKTKKNLQNEGKNQPFFKTVSRDQRNGMQVKDANNSRFGMYNPKFHLIYEKSPLYPDLNSDENKQRLREFYSENLHFSNSNNNNNNSNNNNSINAKNSKKNLHGSSDGQVGSQSQLNSASALMHIQDEQSIANTSMLGIDFDKPRKRIICPVGFDKQAGRKPLLQATIPHDKRFEVLETSFVSSKTPHMPNISFDHQTKDNHRMVAPKTGGLDYNVNYSSVHVRPTIGILDFSKVGARSQDRKSPVYTLNEHRGNENYYSMAQKNKQLSRKVSAPYFDKMTSRDDLTSFHDAKISQIEQIKANALKGIRK